MTTGTPLVTVLGASGFLGSAVTALLARRPVRLRAVSRRPYAPPPAVTRAGPARLDIRTADLTDRAALADAVAGSDAVIHLVTHRSAAGDWRTADGDAAAERTNVTVMRDLVEILGARDRRRNGADAGGRGARDRGEGPPPTVVFASTAGLAHHAGPPATTYERQKLAAERTLHAASASGSLHGLSLRLPTVHGHVEGGGPDRGVVTAMTRRALAGEPLTLWHDGTVRRDLLHVDDAARAFLAALDHAPALAGRPWPVGSDRSRPLGEVFRTVVELVARHTGRPAVPVLTVEPPGGSTGTDFLDVEVDSSAFRAATGWRPRAALGDALERTVAALAAAATATPRADISPKEGNHL
ncbi:NAD-dependent epimerase/dehydratase family protein [Streptomyces roseolus]|uniref:NAD-dependent epimerase/dehydratase family protein n=1 Tax=Streptomyces roseolus TaxID=67358 RepID=UPI0036F70C8D